MKLAFRDIAGFVKSPPRDMVAILVYGPDEGLVRERAQIIGKTVVADLQDAFNVIDLPCAAVAEDPARLNDEFFGISMMGGNRLVRIRDAEDACEQAVAALLEKAVRTDTLLLLEAGNLGTGSKLRKLFEKSGKAAAVPCYVEEARDIAPIIRDIAKSHGFTLAPEAVELIASFVTGDRGMARQETEKLMLYAASEDRKKPLSSDLVRAAIGNNSEQDLDALAQAVAMRNNKNALHILDKIMADGTPAVGILRALQGYFRKLHFARGFVEQNKISPADAVAKIQPKVFWKLEKPMITQVAAWSLAEIEEALEQLQKIEAQCKTSGAPDALLLSHLCLALSSRQQRLRA